jgi:hypothetical protein
MTLDTPHGKNEPSEEVCKISPLRLDYEKMVPGQIPLKRVCSKLSIKGF